jgi:hypothetical protein
MWSMCASRRKIVTARSLNMAGKLAAVHWNKRVDPDPRQTAISTSATRPTVTRSDMSELAMRDVRWSNISVLNIRLTCEWHKAIKLNYKNTCTCVIVVLRLPSTLRRPQLWRQSYHALLTAVYRTMSRSGHAHWTSMTSRTAYSTWTPSPHISMAIISVTVQLWIQVFWVISV